MAGQVTGTQGPDDPSEPAGELVELRERCRLLEEENGRLRHKLNDPSWLRQRVITLFGSTRGPALGFALGVAAWAMVTAVSPVVDDAFRRIQQPGLVVHPGGRTPTRQAPMLPLNSAAAAEPTPLPTLSPSLRTEPTPSATTEVPILPLPVATPSLPLPPLPLPTPSLPLP